MNIQILKVQNWHATNHMLCFSLNTDIYVWHYQHTIEILYKCPDSISCNVFSPFCNIFYKWTW